MMENWVADSKRGPLQHAPEGSAATLNKRRVRRCDKRHPATHWETPERVSHTTLRSVGEFWNYALGVLRPLARRCARERACEV